MEISSNIVYLAPDRMFPVLLGVENIINFLFFDSYALHPRNAKGDTSPYFRFFLLIKTSLQWECKLCWKREGG
jgi:hypothetical protein